MTSNAPVATGALAGVAAPVSGLLRLILAGGLAVIITVGLFMLMQALIHDESEPVPAGEPMPVIQISFDIPDHRLTQLTLDDIVAVEPPPPHPSIRAEAQTAPGVEPISMAPPVIEYVVETLDTMPISLTIPPLTTRVDPVYPQREQARGIQGTCTVQYDILASGRTANARVLACDSDGFARASLAAVARWSHAMEMGRPGDEVVRRGVQTQLDFRLE